MKRVFSSHSQLAHVWAQQSQAEGRASRMFFVNTTDIYSYGYHYLAAKIHAVKGKRFALIRSDAYSVSTAGHLADIQRAVRDRMPVFETKYVSDISKAVKDLDAEVSVAIENALKRKFFADSAWRETSEKEDIIAGIYAALGAANELRALVGRAPLKMPVKFREVETHLEKLEAKYNSPERVAKRAAREEKAKAEREAYRAQRAKENAKSLANFRAGKNFGWVDSEYDLLRISNDGRDVQTSGGAEVPLRKALLLLEAIEAGHRETLAGRHIGPFTVERFGNDASSGEEFVKIGCHKILLSEARNVLRAKRRLSLVTA